MPPHLNIKTVIIITTQDISGVIRKTAAGFESDKFIIPLYANKETIEIIIIKPFSTILGVIEWYLNLKFATNNAK